MGIKTCLLALVVAFVIATGTSECSAAEWRWAKPLNEKPGSLLYTTNRSFKRSSQYTTSSTIRNYPNVPTKRNLPPTTLPILAIQTPVKICASTNSLRV